MLIGPALSYCVCRKNSLIVRCSRKKKVVARSNYEVEYMVISEATSKVIWNRSLLIELGLKASSHPVLWCDNVGAITLASNPIFHARTKHIEIDVHLVGDNVLAKELDIRFVPSKDQIVGVFTLAPSIPKFYFLRDKLTFAM